MPSALERHIAAHRFPDLDSRVHGVSIGVAGMIRPKIRDAGGLVEQVVCLSCGAPGGYVSVDLPPGVIYICQACDNRNGPLPLEAVHFPTL